MTMISRKPLKLNGGKVPTPKTKPTATSLSQKKELFDHIVRSMRDNKLQLVKFEGFEVTKLIHEEPKSVHKSDSDDVASPDDEDLYWSSN